MDVTEIVLLVAGGAIFMLSFLIPDRRDKNRDGKAMQPMVREEVRGLVDQEMDAVKEHVDDVVNEAVAYAMDKTERSLERLSNEKIMAINEYSDTVMSEIHRNHEEAMFLYDMLNSKHTNLKDTVSKVTQTVKEVEETVSTFQKLAPEPVVLDPISLQTPVNDPKPLASKPLEASTPAHSAPKAAFARAAEEELIKRDAAAKPLWMEVEEVSPTEENISEGGNSNDRILQLNQQGMDAVSIAKELGLGVGEVKLVIDLFDGGNQGK